MLACPSSAVSIKCKHLVRFRPFYGPLWSHHKWTYASVLHEKARHKGGIIARYTERPKSKTERRAALGILAYAGALVQGIRGAHTSKLAPGKWTRVA